MKVRGSAGKLLGTVGQVESDPTTGEPVSFTIRYGLLRRKEKRIPTHEIKQIADDTIVLRFTRGEFKELPDTSR
jgi:sporulation protein YlmC with PRC-barrel domain